MKTKIISFVLCLALLSSLFIPAYATSIDVTEKVNVSVVEKDLETNKVEEKVYSNSTNGTPNVKVIDSWIDKAETNFDVSEDMLANKKFGFDTPYSIIGDSDGRTKVSSTKVHPYSAIVYLDIFFGAINVRGTGFLISDNVVATAGHCIYDDEYGWATSISVMPGKTGYGVFHDPYGVATAKKMAVSHQWLNSNDSNYDWGAIEIRSGLIGNPGKINIASLSDNNSAIKISGYPGEFAGKTTYAQYEMSGAVSFSTSYRYYYTIDTSGGQSGAPILDANNVAVGIHTSGDKTNTYNSGIKFTDSVLYYLNLCISNGVGYYE